MTKLNVSNGPLVVAQYRMVYSRVIEIDEVILNHQVDIRNLTLPFNIDVPCGSITTPLPNPYHVTTHLTKYQEKILQHKNLMNYVALTLLQNWGPNIELKKHVEFIRGLLNNYFLGHKIIKFIKQIRICARLIKRLLSSTIIFKRFFYI